MTGTNPELARRRWPNRALRWAVDPWVDWLYWRLDLNDRSGRPVHSKVLSTFAFFLGCLGIVVGSWWLFTHERTSITAFGFILAYSALVFSMPFGIAGYKLWATTKGGGTVDAVAQLGTAELEAVLERRKAGGDYEVTE